MRISLQLSSEVNNPSWTYSLILDGIEILQRQRSAKNVNINGWLLSYPSNREIYMKVTMEGTAPIVDVSQEKIVIAIRELNHIGSTISGTETTKKKW